MAPDYFSCDFAHVPDPQTTPAALTPAAFHLLLSFILVATHAQRRELYVLFSHMDNNTCTETILLTD